MSRNRFKISPESNQEQCHRVLRKYWLLWYSNDLLLVETWSWKLDFMKDTLKTMEGLFLTSVAKVEVETKNDCCKDGYINFVVWLI